MAPTRNRHGLKKREQQRFDTSRSPAAVVQQVDAIRRRSAAISVRRDAAGVEMMSMKIRVMAESLARLDSQIPTTSEKSSS